MRSTLTLCASLLCLSALPGCSSFLSQGSSAAAGVAGAGIANAVTSNGAVAAGIGLGVQAGAQAGLQYVEKRVHHAEQVRIATSAGKLPVGAVGTWSVSHDLPIESDEHGEVTVSREISGGPLACKEIVFSVDTKADGADRRAFYVATICRDGATWAWATAEPATERWGALQ